MTEDSKEIQDIVWQRDNLIKTLVGFLLLGPEEREDSAKIVRECLSQLDIKDPGGDYKKILNSAINNPSQNFDENLKKIVTDHLEKKFKA